MSEELRGGHLSGVRVLEIASMLSGPFASRLLGDLGADVIKLEPLEGDQMRSIGPMQNAGIGAIQAFSTNGFRFFWNTYFPPTYFEAISLIRNAPAAHLVCPGAECSLFACRLDRAGEPPL